MNQDVNNQGEKLKEDCKFEIIRVEDDVEEIKEISNETLATIHETLNQVKDWVVVASDEAFKLCDKTITAIKKVRNDEEMKTKFEEGKDKIVKVGGEVIETIGEGIDNVMNNETVQNVVHTAGEKIEQVKNDERVIEGVKSFKRGTLKVATSAFNGLKKVLATEDDVKENKEDKEEIKSIEQK
ncbi:MAG: hypothetical protein RR646_01380 [Erysipelotrichaceae bacterium]